MLSDLPDREMIIRAQRGDKAAFNESRRRHEKVVVAACHRFFGQVTEDVEDAIQDTWLRVWKALASFRGDSGLSTWLYVVARSACQEIRKKNMAREHTVEQQILVDCHGETVEEFVLRQQALQELLDLVRSCLDERDFRIAMFTYDLEMTSAEIAALLQMTDSNVRKRLRETIRPMLHALGQETFGSQWMPPYSVVTKP